MAGFLFEQIIFGPIRSRRLGVSLGINLLPPNLKHCSFNCLYCECGWTSPPDKCHDFPARNLIKAELENKLSEIQKRNSMLDNITFAGNGEPTLHPEFAGIIDDTVELRNKYIPSCKISVLCNSTMAGETDIFNALLKVDKNIMKLDAGTDETFQKINNPKIKISISEVIESLKKFDGNLIIQTLFVKGNYKGVLIDNTTEAEVDAWLNLLKQIKPRSVMIYPIARETPAENLEKVSHEKLFEIAQKVEALGFEAEVYS
ncbi:MAG: radical SAM protein [Bacteroidetes bacterium]|nr:radical SAM protein [Bacteroidota bacterium]